MTDMLPVAVHVPVIGSYNSAVAVPWPPPPAASTFPFRRRVAVPKAWNVVMPPVDFQVPVAGSYSSALVRKLPPTPPATRTVPLDRRTALGLWRPVAMEPVTRNVNGPAAMALLAIVAARSNDSAPRRVEIPTPFFTERALFSRTNSDQRAEVGSQRFATANPSTGGSEGSTTIHLPWSLRRTH